MTTPTTPTSGAPDAAPTSEFADTATATTTLTAAPGPAPVARSQVQPTRPRIRWAAIVWGVVFALTTGVALFVLLNSQRIEAAEEWAGTLSPTTVTLYLLLAVGSLIFVAGLTGVLRRLQKRGASQVSVTTS